MNKIEPENGVEKLTLKVTSARDGSTQLHEVEAKPMTILCHQGGMDIEPADGSVSIITAVDTVGMADALDAETWKELRAVERFAELFKMVFEFDPPEKLATNDTKHVVGMILLMGITASKGKRPFLKLPETHLHPRQQANLASMLVSLTNGGRHEPEFKP